MTHGKAYLAVFITCTNFYNRQITNHYCDILAQVQVGYLFVITEIWADISFNFKRIAMHITGFYSTCLIKFTFSSYISNFKKVQLTFEIICTPLKMEPHYSIIFSHLITTPAVSMMLGVRCYYPLMHMHGFIGRELLILWFLYIYNKVRVLQIRKYASMKRCWFPCILSTYLYCTFILDELFLVISALPSQVASL